DRPYRSVADPIALLGDYVGDQQNGAFIIRPRSRCDLFEICLAQPVFTEKPIHRPEGHETSSADLAAFPPRVPFVEQSIQPRCSAAIAIVAAGERVVRAQRPIRDGAAQLAV